MFTFNTPKRKTTEFMKRLNWTKCISIFLGFFALCWFLIRVIPKPSRATYPCQQAAFPIASSFVIWLTSLFTSTLLFVKFRRSIKENKVVYALVFVVLLGISCLIQFFVIPTNKLFAQNTEKSSIAYWEGPERTARLKGNITNTFDEVAIVKSSQAQAADIEFNEIETLVREAVALAGGINEIITNGDYVVLKPNLVELPRTPTANYVEVSGMATDWRVVKSVAKMVRELNPDGKIYIIESSATSSTREVLNYYNYMLENFPEVDQIVALEDSCGAFEDYNDSNLSKIMLNDTTRLYPDDKKPNLSPEYYINKIVNNADVVISIPVLKNHKSSIITGGVKNVAIGTAPPNIYGMSATFFGKWTKIDHSPVNLNKWIHDFYLCKPVDFVIVDGLQGFDHGPTGIEELSMEQMQHNMRLILAGKKALSVDAVCGHIMSLDPLYSDYMIYLDKEKYGLGTINSKYIRVKGLGINSVREIFQHNSELTANAIYTDYSPPEIQVNSTSIEGNTLLFLIESTDDLNKLELEINGVLLDQVCVKDFTSVSFEIGEDLFPIDSVKLFAYDRFFNVTQKSIEIISSINEENLSLATLDQNYPNPFANSTTISFKLQKPCFTKMYISDVNGRRIKTVVNNKLQAGSHQVEWGAGFSSGIYLYTLEYEGKRITKRMIKN